VEEGFKQLRKRSGPFVGEALVIELASRFALFAVALTLAFGWSAAAAPAAVEMSTGLRHIEASAPLSDCSVKAKNALNSNLQNAFETSPDSGMWLAYGAADASGHASAAAAIHCFPVGKGYVVTFTCSVELPPSLFSASDLCLKINATFLGKVAAALPTPTPVPTGCSTVNLVGTWIATDKDGALFVFDANGGLMDNQGVSGNWALNGNSVSLVYYGTNTLTLSADGKKLSAPRGVPLNFTRKC
jgi:hypothetical protein